LLPEEQKALQKYERLSITLCVCESRPSDYPVMDSVYFRRKEKKLTRCDAELFTFLGGGMTRRKWQ